MKLTTTVCRKIHPRSRLALAPHAQPPRPPLPPPDTCVPRMTTSMSRLQPSCRDRRRHHKTAIRRKEKAQRTRLHCRSYRSCSRYHACSRRCYWHHRHPSSSRSSSWLFHHHLRVSSHRIFPVHGLLLTRLWEWGRGMTMTREATTASPLRPPLENKLKSKEKLL